MAGIFPDGGVPCNQTQNTVCEIPMEANCEARFYSMRCLQSIDPLQINAIISEIGNVLKMAGFPYDCAKLDNLANAIHKMIMDQDELTRIWVLERLEELKEFLIEKIDTDIQNAKNELNLRMDTLIFECLKGLFPSSDGFTNVSALGVGLQNAGLPNQCRKIVTIPTTAPVDNSFKYTALQNKTITLNTATVNTSGKMRHLFHSSLSDRFGYTATILIPGGSSGVVARSSFHDDGTNKLFEFSIPYPAGWAIIISGGPMGGGTLDVSEMS